MWVSITVLVLMMLPLIFAAPAAPGACNDYTHDTSIYAKALEQHLDAFTANDLEQVRSTSVLSVPTTTCNRW